MPPAPEVRKPFSMIREFHLADWITLEIGRAHV